MADPPLTSIDKLIGIDIDILVNGLEHFVFHIFGIIIPSDELIFFRWVGQPPTSYHRTHHVSLLGRRDPKDPKGPVVSFGTGSSESSVCAIKVYTNKSMEVGSGTGQLSIRWEVEIGYATICIVMAR